MNSSKSEFRVTFFPPSFHLDGTRREAAMTESGSRMFEITRPRAKLPAFCWANGSCQSRVQGRRDHMEKTDQSLRICVSQVASIGRSRGTCESVYAPKRSQSRPTPPPAPFGGGFVQLLMSEMHAGSFPLTLPGSLLGHSCLICRLSLSPFSLKDKRCLRES